MVHSSNPRLMNRVLDAVVNLCEGKGSTARDVLDFLRQSSKSSPRNLTMQVQRALKHAVNAGLLRHRSGRYKALFTLNPAPVKQPVNENNDEKSSEGATAFDAQQPSARVSPDRREENRSSREGERRERRRKRSGSRQRRRPRRRSGSRKGKSQQKDGGEIRKPRYKERAERDRSPRRRISESRTKADIGAPSTSSPNRKRSKPKPRDQTYYSDLSDSADYEDKRSRERRRTPARQECKYDGKRSVSRNRSPQRQPSQHLQMKLQLDDDKGNKTDSDNRRPVDRINSPVQNMENDHEPNNSGSGSTL